MLALIRRYRELILVAALLLVPLGVYVAQAKAPGDRSRVDRVVLVITSPLERLLSWSITGVLRGWYGYVSLRGAHERARQLDREVTELRIENERLRQEQLEHDRLRRLLALSEAMPERRCTSARVIGVGMGPAGYQTLTLDRGSDDGLARMMSVVVADGLVGRVRSVTGHTADVLLAIDRNSSIAVRVERTRARANVRGNGKPSSARLEYALRSEDMIEGDRLVTSGTDGVFPRGLLVGTVTRIQRRPHGLFQTADVIPAVDPTRVEEVLVITAVEGEHAAPTPPPATPPVATPVATPAVPSPPARPLAPPAPAAAVRPVLPPAAGPAAAGSPMAAPVQRPSRPPAVPAPVAPAAAGGN
ncbi:MAG TPA: rod shape-determining protein MreC [Anaeromyxobacteraceae bacterium]|nr:rod shape-determining protein MreC [Anaeromyxobacteraceae bacterium]